MMKNWICCLLVMPTMLLAQDKLDDDLLLKKGVDLDKHVPVGIQTGEQAPKIEGYLLDGSVFNSLETLKETNLVVIFYRGKWCPYCNRHLSNLNDSLSYIQEAGAKVLVIGPETFENADKTADKNEINFILLPDTSMQIMQAFDVLFSVTKKYQGKIKTFLFTNIAENNNQGEAQLPVPATYVIGKDGTIKWRHFDYDYTKRSTAKQIIDALKKL